MCAIAGLMGPEDSRAEARVAEMLELQRHRGPDGSGILCAGGMAIGHRRLAILGLGNAGRQPMTSRDGRWSLVFNGEIFNYRELGAELAAGFASGTDTEVLLEAIAAWGLEAGLGKAAGMFALALWDHREKELSLARDRLGEKPLVYFYDGRILAFASEMKALRGLHGGATDPVAVDAYLALGYVPAPLAIFRSCRKLEAGQWLRCKIGGEPRLARWWVAGPSAEAPRDQCAALRERVGAAVRQRLRADVPVALSLSGGVDSSVIAAECARQGAAIESFTVRFDGDSSDADAAGLVARHLGLRHHVLDVGGAGPGVEQMLRHYDEPFADSSAIPSLGLARALAGRYKVVLNGDGGDEIFGGYRHYEHIQIKQALKAAAAAVGWCDGRQAGGGGVYVQSKVTFRAAERRRLLEGHGGGNALDGLMLAAPGRALARGMWIDRHLALANGLNYKTDIAYGAFGMEGRAPFLDHRLGEWAGSLRARDLVCGREKKVLLRAAYARDLPAGALDRPKRGFGAPVGRWLRGPLRDMVRDVLPQQRGWNDQQVWTLLIFALWAREWRASW